MQRPQASRRRTAWPTPAAAPTVLWPLPRCAPASQCAGPSPTRDRRDALARCCEARRRAPRDRGSRAARARRRRTKRGWKAPAPLHVVTRAGGGGELLRVRRWEVEGGVAVEEPRWHQREPAPLDGHHRPVLGAHDVGDAERVPEHDVGVDEWTVGGRPPW